MVFFVNFFIGMYLCFQGDWAPRLLATRSCTEAPRNAKLRYSCVVKGSECFVRFGVRLSLTGRDTIGITMRALSARLGSRGCGRVLDALVGNGGAVEL